jgi:hypothetical protein
MADDSIQLDAQPAAPLPGEKITVASSARTRVSYAHLTPYAVVAFLTLLVFIGVLTVQYLNHQFYIENNLWPNGISGVP